MKAKILLWCNKIFKIFNYFRTRCMSILCVLLNLTNVMTYYLLVANVLIANKLEDNVVRISLKTFETKNNN